MANVRARAGYVHMRRARRSVVVVVIREYMVWSAGDAVIGLVVWIPVLYAVKVSYYAPVLLVHVQRSSVTWTVFREHMVLWRI